MRHITSLGLAAVLLTPAAGFCQLTTTPGQTPSNTPTTTKNPTGAPSPLPTPKDTTPADEKKAAAKAKKETDVLPSPGEAMKTNIKAGSEDDVNAIGTRNIGGRGMGNWYSTNWGIGGGKQ